MPRPKDAPLNACVIKKKLILDEEELTPNAPIKKKLPITLDDEKEEVKLTPGATANKNGSKFEKKVSLTKILTEEGYYVKTIGNNSKRTYLYKETTDENGDTTKFYFFKQRMLQHYLKSVYPKDEVYSKLEKIPDEVVLIEKGDKRVLNIIEVKWQTVAGSVAEKINGAQILKETYEYLFTSFASVRLCYVLSPFLIETFNASRIFNHVVKPMLERNNIPYFTQTQLIELKTFATSM